MLTHDSPSLARNQDIIARCGVTIIFFLTVRRHGPR
jgi:hypothetical protein